METVSERINLSTRFLSEFERGEETAEIGKVLEAPRTGAGYRHSVAWAGCTIRQQDHKDPALLTMHLETPNQHI